MKSILALILLSLSIGATACSSAAKKEEAPELAPAISESTETSANLGASSSGRGL